MSPSITESYNTPFRQAVAAAFRESLNDRESVVTQTHQLTLQVNQIVRELAELQAESDPDTAQAIEDILGVTFPSFMELVGEFAVLVINGSKPTSDEAFPYVVKLMKSMAGYKKLFEGVAAFALSRASFIDDMIAESDSDPLVNALIKQFAEEVAKDPFF